MYRSLEQPTPQDQRWAGLCLQLLQKPKKAKELLLTSIKLGCLEANIQLAGVHRMLNEINQAEEILDALDHSKFSSFDQILMAREWGMIYYQVGQLAPANKALGLAWEMATSKSEAKHLISHISFMLGLVLSARGYVSQAKNHFDQALEGQHQTRQTYVLANRGLCLTYLGEFEAAQTDLELALEYSQHVPVIKPVLHFYFGQLARARGELSKAAWWYQESIMLSEAVGESETEFYAHLGASTIYIYQDLFSEVRRHLARARLLATGTKMLAYIDLREGAMLTRLNQEQARVLLDRAVIGFESLGLERETGWARLHLGEFHLRHGNNSTALIFIDAATDVRNALGIGAAISLELRGLPFVLETISKAQTGTYSYHLLEDWQKAKGTVLSNLQIRSLGGVALTYNGTKVKLNAGLATSIEVVAYLLKNPHCSLEQIISNVFSEKLPETAKRYFHLIRTELKQNIPGFSIPFDDTTRTYHVELSNLQLQWDVNEMTRAIGHINSSSLKRALEWYKGDFLPNSESEWALEERARLEWKLLRFGLNMLEESFEKREFETCLSSAEQILEFDKGNETVLDYLIRSTFEVKGPKVGLRELERFKKRFLNEFGSVPEVLERLSLKYHKVS